MKARCCLAIGVLCLLLPVVAIATNVSDFKVNDDFGTTYQGYSNIATDLNGDFVVCWYDKRNGNNDIYIQLFDRNGVRLNTNRRVNDDTGTNEQLKPSMMKDQSGKFVVVWQDYRANGYPNNADIMGERFLADGTAQGANFKTNDDFGTETQGWQDIDCDDYGNFVVVWEDNRNGNYDIYAQRYHKSGTKLGANFRVNDDAGAAYQHNPRVTVDGTGNFVIVWYDNRSGRDDILGQRFNASGVAQGTNFMINDNVKNEKHVMPDVACDYNGNFAVVWIDYRNGSYPTNPDIYGKMYWADGSNRSGNFKINADGGQASQSEPVIGMDYFGNYIIAWRDDREGNNDVYAQYYDNTGRLVGGNYRVNTDVGTATQSFPNVTMDGINIYYTWTDDRNGSFDVYAKISEYGSPTMVITPMSFQFTAELGGSNPTTQNLLISNLGYGILNWRATSNQSWLQVTPATGTAPSTAVVSVSTTGLAYGSYNGRITIADVSGKDSSRTAVVALDITAPVMQIVPQTMNIEAHLGMPPPDDKFVQIYNTGTGTLNWTLSGMPSWLKFSMTSGTAPSATDVIILTDSIPSPGQYTANVVVTSTQAINSPETLTVQLSYLADAPIIATDPDTVHLTFAVNATTITPQELVIYNIGVGTLNWTISADATWVSLSSEMGVGDAVVNVGAKASMLAVGDHYSQLTITDPSSYNSPHYAVVHAHVTDTPPIIQVAPDSLSFLCYNTGPQDSARTVSIANGGGGNMSWSVTENAVWLSFNPSSGSGAGQTLATVSTGGLPNGNYTTWAYFNAPGSTNLKDSIFVRLQIAAWLPDICGLPPSLQFLAREDQALVDTQTVTVNTCAAPGIHWSIAASPAWLSASPATGTESQSSNIIMNTAGMVAGTYSGQIVVSAPEASNSPVTVPVTLQVLPRDTSGLWSQICGLPPSLQFLARENLAFADTQTVTVNTCAAPGIHWSIAASPSWLSASPATGTETQSSNIIMNTAGMVAGTYSGQIVVSAPEASNSPVTVPVTLQVLPSDTIALPSPRVVAGEPFALDLRLHNLLPVDSVYLLMQFDNNYFVFDSISAASRLAGLMTFQVVSQQVLAHTQTTIATVKTSSQIPRGNGNIAILHLQAVASANDGVYPVTCSPQLRDSLGLLMTLPAVVGQVTVSGQTPVDPEPTGELPREFHLYQNFPNPFNSSTIVYYSLERGTNVRLEVLNIIGQSVRTLFSGYQSVGGYSIAWDGRNDYAQSIGSGIYFVRLVTDTRADYVRAVLLK